MVGPAVLVVSSSGTSGLGGLDKVPDPQTDGRHEDEVRAASARWATAIFVVFWSSEPLPSYGWNAPQPQHRLLGTDAST